MIILLIIFFIVLIILACSKNNIIEGLTNTTTTNATDQYQTYNTNDPQNALILSQKNAGNIEYLKERIDDIQSLNSTVADLQKTVDTLQTQVNGLVASNQQYVTQMTNNKSANNSSSGNTSSSNTSSSNV